MKKSLILLLALATALLSLHAADPTATDYTLSQCAGSAMPYPVPTQARVLPDSLTPVMLNHVGRHGARFFSSSKYTTSVSRSLDKAKELKTITPVGRELDRLVREVVAVTAGRWGALDSIGMAEQRGIASRTRAAMPGLFSGTKIHAISSYVPRCIASMDEFTHQLSRLDNKIEIYTSSGRQNNALMRPWVDDADYNAFVASTEWQEVYDPYIDSHVAPAIASKILGANYPFEGDEARDFVRNVYSIVAGCASIGVKTEPTVFFTREQYNSLWSVENLHHYLLRSANTLSRAPMDAATDLLSELLQTLQKAADGEAPYAVELRFGHAETLMPLLALMHLQGCYYMTNYFDTVGQHWRDFYVVPMASNLQMTLLRAASGRLYLRVDLNEQPLPLIPGTTDIYTPWPQAREYLTRCLPLDMQ